MVRMRSWIAVVVSLFLVVGLGHASPGTQTSSITIASFNIKAFGDRGANCKTENQLRTIARILSEYDLVALQEVKPLSTNENNKPCFYSTSTGGYSHIRVLLDMLSAYDGSAWEYVCVGPLSYKSQTEYYVILYNTTTITYLGSPTDVGTCRNQTELADFKVRPPMYAYFRSGNFDFILLNYHAPSAGSSVNPKNEAPKLWTAFAAAPGHASSTERDVILLGDFNLTDPERYLPPEALRLVYGVTTSANPYDTIIIDSRYTRYEYTGLSGIDGRPITQKLSDHAIVWARFWTHLEDDD